MSEAYDASEWSSAAQCVFDRIAEKWTLHVIAKLSARPMHFLALHRALSGVSKKVLTETLRRLECDGLLMRRSDPSQATVEYSLTTLGESLCLPLGALRRWSEDNVLTVEQARREFDSAPHAARRTTRQPTRTADTAARPRPPRRA